jgi:hypothetical protein
MTKEENIRISGKSKKSTNRELRVRHLAKAANNHAAEQRIFIFLKKSDSLLYFCIKGIKILA